MEKQVAKRIAVIAPFVGDGKEILLGISESVPEKVDWVLRPIDSLSSLSILELEHWNPEAAIVFGILEGAEAFLVEHKIPYVRVLEHKADDRISTVSINNNAVAQMAAEYFLNRNFANFAYCGNENLPFSLERRDFFVRALEAAGKTVHVFLHPSAEAANREKGRLTYHEDLGNWLMTIPKPVALFASNDWDALEVSQTCAFRGIRIPKDVSILGVGNDDLACMFSRPQLSTIQLPLRQVAREAVSILLSQLEQGAQHVMRGIQMMPVSLVTRTSTQYFPVNDDFVAEVLKYMVDHVNQPLKIQDMLRHFDISRSKLEKRFRAVLGRTPLMEMRRLRIEQARHFLLDTDLSIKKVGKTVGFSSDIRFITVFRELTQMSPTEFRATYRSS